MKIRELINQLQKLDPELDVVLRGYEGGYYDKLSVTPITIVPDVHTEWYYGPHEDADYFTPDELISLCKKEAVLIY